MKKNGGTWKGRKEENKRQNEEEKHQPVPSILEEGKSVPGAVCSTTWLLQDTPCRGTDPSTHT